MTNETKETVGEIIGCVAVLVLAGLFAALCICGSGYHFE